jgi:hypothetical protein
MILTTGCRQEIQGISRTTKIISRKCGNGFFKLVGQFMVHSNLFKVVTARSYRRVILALMHGACIRLVPYSSQLPKCVYVCVAGRADGSERCTLEILSRTVGKEKHCSVVWMNTRGIEQTTWYCLVLPRLGCENP